MKQIRASINPSGFATPRPPRRQLGFVCALLFAFSSAHGAPTGTIQAKRFNPAGLQADLIALSRMEARPHSDDRLRRARNHLSAKWLPILQAAEAASDPIATFILRDCDSAIALNRKTLASTCSTDPGAREKALEILDKLGAPWSIEEAIRTLESDRITNEKQASEQCPNTDKDSCVVKAAIEKLETRLKLVEDNARLDIVTPWNTDLCPNLNNRPDLQAMSARCETLRHHLLAVKTLARNHFMPSLRSQSIDADETERAETYPYAHFDEVRLDTLGAANGPDFQNAFYGGVYRSLFLMEANVRSRMDEDARIGIFLRALPVGADRARVQRTLKPVSNKHPHPANERLREAQVMWGYTGTYSGGLISNGTDSVITKLYPDGPYGLAGSYMMISGKGMNATVQLGQLGPCLVPAKQELLCIWHDHAGVGSVSMLFNSGNTKFKGLWNSLNDRRSRFSRMERRFWNEMTLWNGTLQ